MGHERMLWVRRGLTAYLFIRSDVDGAEFYLSRGRAWLL